MRRVAIFALVAVLGTTLWAFSGAAQTADVQALKKEIDGLKEGLTAIQKDLQEIKNLLRTRPTAGGPPPPPQEVMVNVDGAPFKGKKDAKVTLVEFTDYQ